MLCNACNKNQATVHLTEIIDEQMKELHLCENCARQKSQQMDSQFGLGDLLGGMADFEKHPKDTEAQAVKCPSCGLTYADFKKLGRLGCGECYFAFKKYLAPLLKRIHGSWQHVGKSPLKTAKGAKKKAQAPDLRAKLQRAIDAEEFEEAAKIRDQIKDMEKKQAQAPAQEGGHA